MAGGSRAIGPEGDASWSSAQGGGSGAQVNTLKSSSWDRWGGGVTWPSRHPLCLSLNTHNQQSEQRRQMWQRPDSSLCHNLKISSHFLLLFKWVSHWDKRQTWGTILWDGVGSVNLILYEPDRTMTERERERFFMVTPFYQVILHLWVITVIVQWLDMNNNCNIDHKLL